MVGDMPPGQVNATRLTETSGNVLSDAIAAVLARLPDVSTLPDASPPPEPSDYDRFVRRLGPRLRDATLENFEARDATAEAGLVELRKYAENLAANVKAGRGILLLGPSGTGKDHLLVSLGKLAAKLNFPVQRISGPDLFASMRDALAVGEERQRIELLQLVPVLILSDPLPPVGQLTPYQATVLYEIVDYRWQHSKPTWCSLNVTNKQEADDRLGSPIVDRLQADAVVIRCCWPSWRRPAIVV